jgi:hypothetical protein
MKPSDKPERVAPQEPRVRVRARVQRHALVEHRPGLLRAIRTGHAEGHFPMKASGKPKKNASQGPGRKNLPTETDSGRPAAAAGAERICLWNGKKYTEGAVVCDRGREYECVHMAGGMRWWNTGRTC